MNEPREKILFVCPICQSADRDDYLLVGKGSQGPGGVPAYDVLRCRRHGVEIADAPGIAYGDVSAVGALDGLYGGDNGDRYGIFMDEVERVRSKAGVLHDVGCGHGHLLEEASLRGWAVRGNDLVLPASPYKHDRFSGPLPDLALPGDSVDVVTQFCVVPHLADPIPELQAAYRLLRPGGWLVSQMPARGLYRIAAHALYSVSRGRYRRALASVHGPGGHQLAYDYQSAVELLRKIGFVDCRVWPFYVPARWSLSRYQLAPLPRRLVATAAVHALSAASRLTGRANHLIVAGRRPGIATRKGGTDGQ